MGKLAHSADRRASRLEVTIPGMIERALADVVAPLRSTIDALVAKLAVCECSQGATEEVTALKASMTAPRRDVDQLKSIDMSMIFGTMEISDMSVDPNMHLATTGDEVRVAEVIATVSDVETDEELLSVVEEASYKGLTEVEEAIIDAAV
ncbi:uncharacterized protein LOC125829443 [Solanum verrucosum]|uniref:uncharacterized protein LOC125829443 n=1 Tax=Solanum verrucosum TaxID=315347 RepID=UPI0020D1E6B2|nr:uncharacterized protein LOC125829443 [Solanum verrucosum]